MPGSYPGSELSVDQLVHALVQTVDLMSPAWRRFPKSGLQKVLGIERKLLEVLEAIKEIKNTFPPINRLPPEILSNILEHRDDELDLIAATHVCRYWRSTLISDPSLWTHLQFRYNRNVDRALTYLERSKSAPMDVEMSLHLPQDLEVSKRLIPHIARTRSLAIDGGPQFMDITTHQFSNPAISLRNLEIRCHEFTLCIPDDFLGRRAPSLQRIYLCNVHPTFESPFPLPNLTEFNLYHDVHLPNVTSPFRMSTLFLFLSGSPRLKKIYINTSHEVLEDDALDQVVSLESLVELYYSCWPAGRILPYLRLPHLEWLYVCFSLGLGQVQKLADFLPYDSHLLLEGATSMEYYHPDSNIQDLAFHGENVSVMFRACLAKEDPIPVDWFSDPKYLPFGHVRRLTVGCSPNNADFPITAFENLEELHTSTRDKPFTEGLFRPLYPGVEIPCRSLRVIGYVHLEPLGPLISLVKARLQAGHRLESVHLPVLTEGDGVAELEEFVGKVLVKQSVPDSFPPSPNYPQTTLLTTDG